MKQEPFTVTVLTLFPEMFPGYLGLALSGKALEKGLWHLRAINFRDYTSDVHKTVDDTPFGGGAGMVMKPDILAKTIEAAKPHGRLIYLSPRGKPLTQKLVQELALEPSLTLLCGRYEGVDQRVLDAYNIEEISIGDFVLSGGEAAAMILIDACVRLIPGVMGNAQTVNEESFSQGLLEYPHYTRPASWTDGAGIVRNVPEVLVSGHHEKIARWRKQQAEQLTKARRPDLWEIFLRDYSK